MDRSATGRGTTETDGGAGGAGSFGRRGLLRGAGAALAVAAGATVAGVAAAGPAHAASGDALTLGTANTSGTDTTQLGSASTSDATLVLSNGGSQAPLRLQPSGSEAFESGTLHGGELMSHDDDLYYVYPPVGGVAYPAVVFNELTALQLVPINPVRMLDTRNASGRTNVVDGSLDAQGRLLGGHWLTLDLTLLGYYFDAVVGNVTVVTPSTNGYLGVQPVALPVQSPTSTVNYVRGITLANGLTAAVNPDDGTLAIYSSATTHVLLDVNALNAPGASWVTVPLPGGSAAIARSRAALAKGAARMHAARAKG